MGSYVFCVQGDILKRVNGVKSNGLIEFTMDSRNVIAKWANCCRLCLLDDGIKLPIFEGEGIQKQVAHKIQTCFPILVILVYVKFICSFDKRFLAFLHNVLCCLMFVLITSLFNQRVFPAMPT